MIRSELTGRQIKAARALAGVTQQQLADAAYLHVNSVRYLERKESIRESGHSASYVVSALREFGVELTFAPTSGVRIADRSESCC